MSYLLIVEGQEIPLTAEVAATDETVRNCIAPFYSFAATAILIPFLYKAALNKASRINS